MRTLLGARAISMSAALRAKILCSDPIHPVCGDVLRERGHEVDVVDGGPMPPDELMTRIGEYDGLVVRSGTKVTKDVLAAGARLRFVGRAGTGVDNIDVTEATRRGVVVMNTPGGNTTAAAELTLTLLLALSRSIPQACASIKGGAWERKRFVGSELAGKTLGVIGLGRIGRLVASWAPAFGMEVIGHDPVLSPEVLRREGITPVPLQSLWEQSDFITLHTPLTKDTRHLINKDTLALCKPGVRIVNVARGGVVNEADLLEALESGHVAGAGLDVFESEPPGEVSQKLIQHPNVVATPHLGASSEEAQVAVARAIAEQFADAFDGRKFVGAVNASILDHVGRPDLLPFLQVAERLGALQAQLVGRSGKVQSLHVQLQGDRFGDSNVTRAIRSAVVKGFLGSLLADQEINFVNVGMLADSVGLRISDEVNPRSAAYTNLITVRTNVEDAEGGGDGAFHEMAATTFGESKPRLVQVGGYRVDVTPEGRMLFFRNRDRPGVLQHVTEVLAKHDVNIANFGLGRHNVGGDALGVLTVDQDLPDVVLDELRALENLFNVGFATLPEDPPRQMRDDGTIPSVVHVSAARRPRERPRCPQFGSGPTKKRPGWTPQALADAEVGRSHRSAVGKAKIRRALDMTRDLLELPPGYRVGLVPGSDTGAFEMAMWTMMGQRPVDVCHWESFGKGWFTDARDQLKLDGLREFAAPYGKLPDLRQTDPSHDVVFTWNGTTSGVRVPNGDWIPADRSGLTFVDATSAVFAQRIPFDKCDVLTYSWQKVLGGEGAHGMLVLSPAAVDRLESYVPDRPLPKVFRMTKKGKFSEDIFEGSTINTPSMLCVEDYLDALQWTSSLGGVAALQRRADENLGVVERFVEANSGWIQFLPEDPETRSNTSVCLSVSLPEDKIKAMVKLLEKEGVAFDIGAYRDAPPGLRIWCGATVEKDDLELLMPWLRWAFHVVSE